MRLVLLVALPVLQATLVPLRGPDLVLIFVLAVALGHGPHTGAVYGFAAGLAADLTPPADHAIGLSALVFCLVGGLSGLRELTPPGNSGPSVSRVLPIAAAGAVAGIVLRQAAWTVIDGAPWDSSAMLPVAAWTAAAGAPAITVLLVLRARRNRARTRSRRLVPHGVQVRSIRV